MKITNKRRFTGFDSNHPKNPNKNGLEFLSDVVIKFNTCNQQKNPKKRIVNIRWQNMVKDVPIRRIIIYNIAITLQSNCINPNSFIRMDTLNMARQLELLLYNLSHSKERYLDMTTLKYRINLHLSIFQKYKEAIEYEPPKYVPIKKKPKK